MPKDVDRARVALGYRAEFALGDICNADFGKSDVVIILDVLHYISYEAQEDVLRRIRASLPTGGTFITRIGDAAGGLPFHYSNWVDRTVFFLRGHRLNRIYCRTQAGMAGSFSNATALLLNHFLCTKVPRFATSC